MTYTDDERAHIHRQDGFDCPFCWGTGVITVMEPHGNVRPSTPVTRRCPEGCLAPEEVPF